jgi:hypothetical protein
MPGCHCRISTPSEPLVQLHRRLTATSAGLRLTVQTAAAGWVARVSDAQEIELYSAYRCNSTAAQIAAAEFAAFRTGCAGPISWTEGLPLIGMPGRELIFPSPA